MLTRDHVVWAYRLLLDRDPESEDVIGPKLRAWQTTRELRTDLMSSAEFTLKNPDHAQTAASTVVIKPLPGGGRLFIDLADHVIGLAVLRDGYERDEVACALGLLRPGDVAVDVGAHIGYFAIQMAAAVGPTGAVYAFEPLERNAALLERSIEDNGFAGRLTLERAAVAATAGEMSLVFAEETLNTGGAFLSDDPALDLGGLQSRTVRTVALDRYPCRRPVRLIKMDVEGAEPSVIAGAEQLLRTDRPFLISEVHPEQLARVSRTSPAVFRRRMADLGYDAFRATADGVGERLVTLDDTAVQTVVFAPVGG